MTESLSPAALAAIGKIQKLLNLAANNPNEAEAAAATAKAQELLAQHNLDAALLERESGKVDGRREEFKMRGGFYDYQVSLWKAVAQLNFCIYWIESYTETKEVKRDGYIGIKRTAQKRHRIVGRSVNTLSTKIMAEYLEGAVERALREHLNGDHKQLFSRWAISFRRGAISRLCNKLYRRYSERLNEERAKQRAASTGPSSSTAVALADYVRSEYDANVDFVYGEGTSARWAAQSAAYDAERAANPPKGEAAPKARHQRAHKPKPDNTDWSAYRLGQTAGEDIGLDHQAGHTAQIKIGGSQ